MAVWYDEAEDVDADEGGLPTGGEARGYDGADPGAINGAGGFAWWNLGWCIALDGGCGRLGAVAACPG